MLLCIKGSAGMKSEVCNTERLPPVRHKSEPVGSGLRPGQPLPLQRQGGTGHWKRRSDRLWSKTLRQLPPTLDNPGPAGGEVLQHLAVCVLQQQSGEFCGSGWTITNRYIGD